MSKKTKNYKITKKIALRIIELRNDGYSFLKITEFIKNEYGILLDRTAIGKFYKNFLNGKSKILPIDELKFNKELIHKKPELLKHKNIKSNDNVEIDQDLKDNALYRDLSGNFSNAKEPSDDLLGLFEKKPLSR